MMNEPEYRKRLAEMPREHRHALMFGEWKPERFRRVSSARLNKDNHCGVFPLVSLGDKRYEVEPGWRVVGWTTAPWRSYGQTKAIVFEKLSSPREHDHLSALEQGWYWCHGDIEEMTFENAVAPSAGPK